VILAEEEQGQLSGLETLGSAARHHAEALQQKKRRAMMDGTLVSQLTPLTTTPLH